MGSTPPVHTTSNLVGESRSTNEEPTERNDQISNSALVNHTTTTSAKGPFKVLLWTAATYAQGFNNSSPVPVRILLDSGSQRSYVTTALKERLKLAPLKTETLNLNTFGDDRFTKQRCDLVKLSLRGKEDDVEISALCFLKICSPLSTSLDVSRYPHLQGLDFADASVVDGSQPNIDILIGSDFYFEVLTGEVDRGDSGPVAVNSKFGWVVSGTMLEKGEMSDMSVTNLVIEKIGSQIPYPTTRTIMNFLAHYEDFGTSNHKESKTKLTVRKKANFYPIHVLEKPKAVTKYSCPGRIIVPQNWMAT